MIKTGPQIMCPFAMNVMPVIRNSKHATKLVKMLLLILLSQKCKNNGPSPLLQAFDCLLERSQVYPVQLLQCVAELNPGLLQGVRLVEV